MLWIRKTKHAVIFGTLLDDVQHVYGSKTFKTTNIKWAINKFIVAQKYISVEKNIFFKVRGKPNMNAQ